MMCFLSRLFRRRKRPDYKKQLSMIMEHRKITKRLSDVTDRGLATLDGEANWWCKVESSEKQAVRKPKEKNYAGIPDIVCSSKHI